MTISNRQPQQKAPRRALFTAEARSLLRARVMANDRQDDASGNNSEPSGQKRQSADKLTERTTGQTGTMATDFNNNISSGAADEAPHLSPSLQGHLGRQLRAAYSELIQEPMPDKFAKLLEELSVSQSKKPAQK